MAAIKLLLTVLANKLKLVKLVHRPFDISIVYISNKLKLLLIIKLLSIGISIFVL